MSLPADRRAYHNYLERKRRDHIKDGYLDLKDCLPAEVAGDKPLSRARIVEKATQYIKTTRQKNKDYRQEIKRSVNIINTLQLQINKLRQMEMETICMEPTRVLKEDPETAMDNVDVITSDAQATARLYEKHAGNFEDADESEDSDDSDESNVCDESNAADYSYHSSLG